MALHSSQIVFNLPTPVNTTDPANKGYADQIRTDLMAILNNLDSKSSVRVAVNTNVNLASPGAALDGVNMNVGDRFALLNQTTPSQNGIYVWNGAAVAATRSTDADTSAKVSANMAFGVDEGSLAGRFYRLQTTGAITLGTTPLVFSLFAYMAGSVPVKANKGFSVNNTTADGNQATTSTVTGTPAAGSHVFGEVNGLMHTVGDGSKAGCDLYVSGDGGTTARSFSSIQSGDTIHWNATNAGYQLIAGTHKLSLHFVAVQ